MTNRPSVAVPSARESVGRSPLADSLFDRVLRIVERHAACCCGEPVLGQIVAVRTTGSLRQITRVRLPAMQRELASPSGSSGRSISRVHRRIIFERGGCAMIIRSNAELDSLLDGFTDSKRSKARSSRVPKSREAAHLVRTRINAARHLLFRADRLRIGTHRLKSAGSPLHIAFEAEAARLLMQAADIIGGNRER